MTKEVCQENDLNYFIIDCYIGVYETRVSKFLIPLNKTVLSFSSNSHGVE
jgi:hypothetical protein